MPSPRKPKTVPDWGKLTSKLVLIGEAPGKKEIEAGIPFTGPSGARLRDWWNSVGLKRDDFRITNVVPYMPKDIAKIPKDEMAKHVEALHRRLADLQGPMVIVPTGNIALRALLGKKDAKITKLRGSILSYTPPHGGAEIKVIPTIHPAATFRNEKLERSCRADWARIAKDSKFFDLRLPKADYNLHPTTKESEAFLSATKQSNTLSIDIETVPTRITCVGFSHTPGEAMTFQMCEENLPMIRALCETKAEKILQNGHYDTYWLKVLHDIELRNWKWDTLAMHHCIEPTAPHDLAWQGSIFTRQPYWKDEAKDPEESAKYSSNLEALLHYNCIDADVTLQLYHIHREALEKAGRLDFYLRHYKRLFLPLMDMMLGGINIDTTTRCMTHAHLTARAIEIEKELSDRVGTQLYAKKSLSSVRLKAAAKALGMKLPRKRATGAETLDEVALLKLRRKHLEHAWFMDLVLEHRHTSKLATFFSDQMEDNDGGFARCTYKFTTESGRLSSAKNPMRKGTNLQNIAVEARGVFIPDFPGDILLEIDQSQAEDRIVKLYSQDPSLIELAYRKPTDYDAHTYNAALIFDVPETEVTKQQRQLGKVTVHGAQRGLGGETMSDNLLKEGLVVSAQRCSKLIRSYHSAFPAIQEAYFPWVRRTLLRDGGLTNSWGRRWPITYERFTQDLYRRAYSFLPQAEVADLMNQTLADIWHWMRKTKTRGRICAQVHDSLLYSVDIHDAYHLATQTIALINRPLTIATHPFAMPATIKVGTSWGSGHEWKELPSREEFDEVVTGMVDLREVA